MNGMQVRIVKNLKERVHPVNEHIALSGIDDFMAGMAALRELIGNGTVKRSYPWTIQGVKPVGLYSLAYHARFDDEMTIRRVK